jgi:hypothetical protein
VALPEISICICVQGSGGPCDLYAGDEATLLLPFAPFCSLPRAVLYTSHSRFKVFLRSFAKKPHGILLLLMVAFALFVLGVEVNDSSNLPRQRVRPDTWAVKQKQGAWSQTFPHEILCQLTYGVVGGIIVVGKCSCEAYGMKPMYKKKPRTSTTVPPVHCTQRIVLCRIMPRGAFRPVV